MTCECPKKFFPRRQVIAKKRDIQIFRLWKQRDSESWIPLLNSLAAPSQPFWPSRWFWISRAALRPRHIITNILDVTQFIGFWTEPPLLLLPTPPRAKDSSSTMTSGTTTRTVSIWLYVALQPCRACRRMKRRVGAGYPYWTRAEWESKSQRGMSK